MRNNKGQFIKGVVSDNYCPIGTIRIRTRHNRGGAQRAFIKVAEPNVWVLRARYVWEQAHGPIPRGMGIHHKDRDKLNDTLNNLELVSKAEHIKEHRADYNDRRIAASAEARRRLRWSTKSTTKRTGRPPTWTDEQMQQAITAYHTEGGTQSAIECRFGIPKGSLAKQLKKA